MSPKLELDRYHDTEADTYRSIANAYIADRQVMNSTHPPMTDLTICRYCGERWRQYGNSPNDGHVRCMVSVPFQRRLVQFFDQHPTASYADVALALGVGYQVVKAWWSNVKMPGRQRIGSQSF